MTYQKAISAIMDACNWNGSGQHTSDELAEAKRMVCEAAKKQIPKKPIVDPAHLVDFQNYHCPKCKNKIIARIDGKWIAGKLQKYCDNCGQALDWSDAK